MRILSPAKGGCLELQAFSISGLGLGVKGLRFGFGMYGFGPMVYDFRIRMGVWGSDFGFRISDFGF